MQARKIIRIASHVVSHSRVNSGLYLSWKGSRVRTLTIILVESSKTTIVRNADLNQ